VSAQRLRTALIGHGKWGRNVARVLARVPECELSVVCDNDSRRLDDVTLPLLRTTHLDEVLSDPRIQACALCTPSVLHAEHAISALRAGKHVFVEKPMALSQAEAEAVAATVLLTGRRLMVGHILLYHPACHELIRLVANGDLGTVRRIVAIRTSSPAAISTENPWWALAPHDISLFMELVPSAVTAIRARRDAGADGESVRAELAFADGTRADLTVGRGPERLRSISVFGDAGSARFRDETPPGRIDVHGASAALSTADDDGSRPPLRSLPIPAAEPLELELTHFIQSILRQRPFRTDHVQGLRVTDILAAGQQSMSSGTTIELSETSSLPERVSA
jgi:UDP-2-acetamido-3-amino-2,3-dideoxy-glucuronate N-acetyltransferase